MELVLPHGVLELSCIAVTAAAGLRIGWALIEPGTLTRGQSLRREARPAMEMVLGTMPWLVLAGLVEGFVTGSTGGLDGAIVVGVGLGVVFWGLVAWRGRSEPGARLGREVGAHAGGGERARGRLEDGRARALEPVRDAGARREDVERDRLAVDVERRRRARVASWRSRSGSRTEATSTTWRRASTGTASTSGRAAASSSRSQKTTISERLAPSTVWNASS